MQYVADCHSKRAYLTEASALVAAERLAADAGHRVDAYACEFSGGSHFHIGRHNSTLRRRRRRLGPTRVWEFGGTEATA